MVWKNWFWVGNNLNHWINSYDKLFNLLLILPISPIHWIRKVSKRQIPYIGSFLMVLMHFQTWIFPTKFWVWSYPIKFWVGGYPHQIGKSGACPPSTIWIESLCPTPFWGSSPYSSFSTSDRNISYLCTFWLTPILWNHQNNKGKIHDCD